MECCWGEVIAIGMGAVDDFGGEFGGEFGGLLAFFFEGGEGLALEFGELIGGESGVESGIGEEIENFPGVFGEPGGEDADGIGARGGLESHADGIGFEGEAGGVAGWGAAIE